MKRAEIIAEMRQWVCVDGTVILTEGGLRVVHEAIAMLERDASRPRGFGKLGKRVAALEKQCHDLAQIVGAIPLDDVHDAAASGELAAMTEETLREHEAGALNHVECKCGHCPHAETIRLLRVGLRLADKSLDDTRNVPAFNRYMAWRATCADLLAEGA